MTVARFGIDYAASGVDLLDRAIEAFGHVDFVGQYLPVYPTDAARVAAIHQRGAAVLPIWNKDQVGARTSGSYQMGFEDAREAVASWRSMGLPGGSMIALDVEQPWYLSGEYLQGWLRGSDACDTVGAAYINPRYGNGHASAWQWACQHGAVGVVFTSQNQFLGQENTPIREWVVDATYGAYPVPGFEHDTVVRQTSIGAFNRTLDLDCASEVGYSLMWLPGPPKPPAPKPHHITVPGALKTQPNNVSPVALGPHGHPLNWLPQGTDVTLDLPPMFRTDPLTGMHYVRISLPGTQAYGWYPAEHIAEGI